MEQFIKHNVIYFANAQAHGFISMAAFLANGHHCMVSIIKHSSVVCALISDELTGTLSLSGCSIIWQNWTGTLIVRE